jgi:hypothetical protein
MDTQIWYAIFSTLVGGIYGACRRLGEVSKTDQYPTSLFNSFVLLGLHQYVKLFLAKPIFLYPIVLLCGLLYKGTK